MGTKPRTNCRECCGPRHHCQNESTIRANAMTPPLGGPEPQLSASDYGRNAFHLRDVLNRVRPHPGAGSPGSCRTPGKRRGRRPPSLRFPSGLPSTRGCETLTLRPRGTCGNDTRDEGDQLDQEQLREGDLAQAKSYELLPDTRLRRWLAETLCRETFRRREVSTA